jgi:hypothetical protein
MKVQLPPYPASGGPATANQADRHRQRYREKIAALRAEIAATEAAFEKALARADAAAVTRSRIDDLAAAAKRKRRI